MNLSIKTSALKASVHCAAKNDLSYYLNGVYIFARGLHCEIVSTNGHILSAFRLNHCSYERVEDESVIIPLEIVKQAVTLHKKAGFIELIADSDTHKLGGIDFTPVEGDYPDYNRVIPKMDKLTVLGNSKLDIPTFDPFYLELARKTLVDFYEGKRRDVYEMAYNTEAGASIMHNGEGSAVVAVMPIRAGNNSIPTFRSLKFEGKA